MEVVATSPDPVRISFLAALLRDAGIAYAVLDAHISAVEGGTKLVRLEPSAEDGAPAASGEERADLSAFAGTSPAGDEGDARDTAVDAPPVSGAKIQLASINRYRLFLH